MDLLVFSKDRPQQLNLLIKSLLQNSDDLFDITVLYTYSNELFKEGYKKLIYRYTNIKWRLENGFRNTTLNILRESKSELFCCMVDDDIFYRKTKFNKTLIKDLINNIPNSVFSFRLGKNITVGDNFTNELVQQPQFNELQLNDEKFGLFWANQNYHNPFQYPISLDGHVFKREWFLKRCEEIDFSSPNFLEGNLQGFNKEFEHIICPLESELTSTPCNRVQSEFTNKTTEQFSAEELNQKWLDGQEIDLEKTVGICNSTHSNWGYILI